MTDTSKRQKKRRLQLNAEEFAPPSDLYQATDTPGLDDTWVQYYGGERQGGLKRLSSLDEEIPIEELNDDTADFTSQLPPTTDDTATSLTQNPPASPLTPQVPAAQTHTEPLAPPLAPRSLSPVKDFPRQDRPRPPVDKSSGRASVGMVRKKLSRTKPTPQSPAFKRNISGVSLGKVPSPSGSGETTPSFEEWTQRWSPWLKRGASIKVCAAFFQLTHAQGSAECLTSNAEIMKITELSRSQCIRNIHFLIEIGFLEELSEFNNKEAKGTYYRFNLVPTSLIPF